MASLRHLRHQTCQILFFVGYFPGFTEIRFADHLPRHSFATEIYLTNHQNTKIMKRIVITLAVLLMAIMTFAQDKSENNEMNTLFGKKGKTTLGWFVGINPGYTKIDGRDAWLGGISAGLIINHNFTIGITGSGWTNRQNLFFNNIDTVNGNWEGAYLEGGYGGLLLEYTLFPNSVVHVTFPLLIGGGGASYVTDNEYYELDEDECDWNHKTLDSDAFFVIEPGVRAVVNILKFLRFNAGVSYHYVPDLNLKNTSSDILNNFSATVGLKFGKF
jgi:hypothetical protein